jgi:ribonuclease P protein component
VRKRAEFERIQKGGERVHTEHFVLIVARQDADGPARLGITASRTIGGAVVRNRAKRLVRAAFRELGTLFHAGVDLVVIVRKSPQSCRLGDVLLEWRGAAGQLERRQKSLLARAARRENTVA